MNARSMMTMRAHVQKDDNAGTPDAHGNPLAPSWSTKETLPCLAWSGVERTLIDEARSALLEDVRCILPKDAAVVSTDRILKITDRRTDREYFSLPLRIDAIQQRRHHKLLVLEVVSS